MRRTASFASFKMQLLLDWTVESHVILSPIKEILLEAPFL